MDKTREIASDNGEKRLVGGKTDTNPENLKALYKTYYRESWKTVRRILTVVGAALILAGVAFYYRGMPLMYVVIPIWIGAVMLIYPRNAYKKPYKESKNEKSSVYFAFYENKMSEKTGGELQTFEYNSIYEVIEVPKYFFFFHTKRDVSILEKEGINKGTPEQLSGLLKVKVKKFVKKA